MLKKLKINWNALLTILFSMLLALSIGAIFMLVGGYDPVEVYWMMLKGAFGNSYNIMTTIQKATPLIFTSLAMLVAFRSGTFNMGVEGQLLIGAVIAAWAGSSFNGLPSLLHIPITLALAALFGAFYAFIPAILKLVYDVNEIITTLMLNTVALLFTGYLVNHPLREGASVAQTAKILDSAKLPRLVTYSQANVGLFIAIGCILLFWFIFNKTTFGYRSRMVGEAPAFAESVGINRFSTALVGMLVSGAIAGLAGGVEVLGVYHRFRDPFAKNLGFDGILIAWLGRATPVGAFFAALFYGGMKTGAMTVDWMTDIPRQLVDTILAIVIFFIATEDMFSWFTKLKTKIVGRLRKPREVVKNA